MSSLDIILITAIVISGWELGKLIGRAVWPKLLDRFFNKKEK
jgi:hypothetical protein